MEGLPAARKGDKVRHNNGTEVIARGELTVRIGGEGRFAARMGDGVVCGGVIAAGAMSVRIGRHPDEQCLQDAHLAGDAVITRFDPRHD